MSFKALFLPEFDQEMASTRRMIAIAPAEAFAWQPHEKSMTLGALVTHLSLLPRWGRSILTRDGYDLAADSAPGPAPALGAPSEALAQFDEHVAGVRERLLETSDAELDAPWTLTRGGKTVMSMPRALALRRFLLNHLIHHRGQLSVYLRLQGVPLPPVYGPTADEP